MIHISFFINYKMFVRNFSPKILLDITYTVFVYKFSYD